MELIELFNKLIECCGQTVANIIIGIILIIYILYFIMKNNTWFITKLFKQDKKEKEDKHAKALKYRKKVVPEIKKTLRKLVEDTDTNRALLFEYSNGSSNLVGLPFLYLTATAEVMTIGVKPVAHKYKRLNTAIISDFLDALETKGYFYIEDLEKLKEDMPIIYGLIGKGNMGSLLCYSLTGVEETIGFITVSSTAGNSFDRDDVLSTVAGASQVISTYLNFNEVYEKL